MKIVVDCRVFTKRATGVATYAIDAIRAICQYIPDWHLTLVSPVPFHKSLVDYFYASEFGGYAELKLISADQYCDFMIYCKKKLRSQGYTELPDLISSNLSGKMTHRLLQNAKFMQKVIVTKVYPDLTDTKYKYSIIYRY